MTGTTVCIGLLLLACAGCSAELSIDSFGESGTAGPSGTGGATSTGTGGETPTGTTTVDPTTGGSGDATTGAAACVPPTGAPGEVLVTAPLTGSGTRRVHAVAVDAAGDTYITGYFRDTITLQGTTVTGEPGINSAYVARLDCAGELVWLNAASPVDAGATSEAHAIVVQDGRVYIGGALSGSVRFTDGDPLVSAGGGAFIAGFDAIDGAAVSDVVFAGETDLVRSLVFADGQLVAAGGCAEGLVTGVLLATWSGETGSGEYACAYATDPLPLDPTEPPRTIAHSVVLHPEGGLVLGGQLSGPIAGWPDPGLTAGSSRAFVAMLATPLDLAAIAPAWLTTFGRDTFTRNRVNALALRGDEIVVAALGTGLTQVGGTAPGVWGAECESPENVHYTALMRLTGAGVVADGRTLCSDAEAADEAWGVTASADRIYVTGQFDGTLRLGGEDLTSEPRPASVRMFVLGLDPALTLDAGGWVLFSGAADGADCGSNPADPRAIIRGATIAAGADGLVVAGDVCGSGISLGATSFTPNPQSYDAFVTKLAR